MRSPDETPELTRFLNIAKQLPLELQMVLCNRACGSAGEIVTKRRLDKALSTLVWRLALEEEEEE